MRTSIEKQYILNDWQLFLKKHRIGLFYTQMFKQLGEECKKNNREWLNNVIEKVPELTQYIEYLVKNLKNPKKDNPKPIDDEKFVSDMDKKGILQGLHNHPIAELHLMEKILDVIEEDAKRFLDIGCGIGHRLSFLKSRKLITGKAIGIDLSEHSLNKAYAIAAQEDADVTFINASAVSLPFEDNSISQIIMCAVLGYIEKWTVALDEICRVLSPGGKVFIVHDLPSFRNNATYSNVVEHINSLGLKIGSVSSEEEKFFVLLCEKVNNSLDL